MPRVQMLELRMLFAATGEWDVSFGEKGFVQVVSFDNATWPQKNGDFILSIGGDDRVNRYRADGTLRSSVKLVDAQGAYDAVPLASGKFLAYSTFTKYDENGGSTDQTYLKRFNADGSLDRTFGENGNGNGALTGFNFELNFAVQSDQRILVHSGYRFYRLTADGIIDPTYHMEEYGFGLGIFPHQILPLASGKAILLSNGGALGMLQLQADGTPDPAFGADGFVDLGNDQENFYPLDVQVLSTGKLLVVGADKANHQVVARRYFADGTLDVAFGEEGSARFSVGDASDLATSIQATPLDDEKILLVSNWSDGVDASFSTLLLMSPDGEVAASFPRIKSYDITEAYAVTNDQHDVLIRRGDGLGKLTLSGDAQSPVQVSNGLLSIDGTSEADDIVVMPDGDQLLVRRSGSLDQLLDPSSLNGISINCGAGDDVAHVDFGAIPATLIGGDGNDRLRGDRGNDKLYGNAGNDRLDGDDGSDLLSGGGGSDRLRGMGGTDRIYCGSGNDVVSGGGGADRITDGPGQDSLSGNAGDDLFSTADGQIDSVNGDGGSDSATADITDVLTSIESTAAG